MPFKLTHGYLTSDILSPGDHFVEHGGHTSLMYTSPSYSNNFKMITLEEHKLQWLRHINLIDDYYHMGVANIHNARYELFMAYVPRLEPIGEGAYTGQRRNIILKGVQSAYKSWADDGKRYNPWDYINMLSKVITEFVPIVEYVNNSRLTMDVYPDMGRDDWMYSNELHAMICIDPFQSIRINHLIYGAG